MVGLDLYSVMFFDLRRRHSKGIGIKHISCIHAASTGVYARVCQSSSLCRLGFGGVKFGKNGVPIVSFVRKAEKMNPMQYQYYFTLSCAYRMKRNEDLIQSFTVSSMFCSTLSDSLLKNKHEHPRISNIFQRSQIRIIAE